MSAITGVKALKQADKVVDLFATKRATVASVISQEEITELSRMQKEMQEGVQGVLDIPALRKLRTETDQRGFLDAVRNVHSNTFDKTGGGVGGNALIEEALGKPAWQHSGRQVKIVNMSPQEYLQKSAEGSGFTYDDYLELLADMESQKRTDRIVQGMSEGKQFQLPYLDYRDGFSQEGNHRALAAMQTGKKKIPVAVMWKKGEGTGSKAIADAEATLEGLLINKAKTKQEERVLAEVTPDGTNAAVQAWVADQGITKLDVPERIERANKGGLYDDLNVGEHFMAKGFNTRGPKNTVWEVVGKEFSSNAPSVWVKAPRVGGGHTLQRLRVGNLRSLGKDFRPVPPSTKGKPTTPELTRAQEQGFDISVEFSHWTMAADFAHEGFRPMSHFGTKKAADDRRKGVQDNPHGETVKAGRTEKVFLKLENPVVIRDNGLYDGLDLITASFDAGYITRSEKMEFISEVFLARGLTNDRGVEPVGLIDRLTELGFDGFVYSNIAEDAGSLSAIPFMSSQIRRTTASFNPKDAHMNDITRGGVGLGVIGAAVAATQSEQAEAGTSGTPHPEMAQIAIDEGTSRNQKGQHISYMDSKNLLTGGVGHLMSSAEKKLYPEGTEIPTDVVDAWFAEDMETHTPIADDFIGDRVVPEEVRNILVNMAFNMGAKRFNTKKWPGLNRGIDKGISTGDWNEAADEMVNSDWFDDVGDRSERLVERMRGVKGG